MVITPVAVDSCFSHWDPEQKVKIASEFTDTMFYRDDGYTQIGRESAELKPSDRLLDVFSAYAAIVLDVCGLQEAEAGDFRARVIATAVKEWEQSDFDNHMRRLAGELPNYQTSEAET